MAAESQQIDPSASPAPATGWMGPFEAFKVGFRAIQHNQAFAALYIAVGFIGVIATDLRPTGGVGFLVAFALSLLLLVAFTKYSLAAAENRVEPLSALFTTSSQEFFRMFGALIVFFVFVILSAIGLLIPLIWVIPWTAFLLYIIISDHLSVQEALRLSKQLGQHHKSQIWGLAGVTILYSLGAIILKAVPVIGWLASTLASSAIGLAGGVATALLYRHVRASHQAAEPQAAAEPSIEPTAEPSSELPAK